MDHVFGGPPYFNQRAYSHWDDYQAYLLDMRSIIENCFGLLERGGVCVWNIANECMLLSSLGVGSPLGIPETR